VALVHGVAENTAAERLPALRTGIERTFDQDPAMARRVLVDIALRALSSAVNDPTTAIEALNGIDQLLRLLADRELAVETVRAPNASSRCLVAAIPATAPRAPAWDERASRLRGL
jgi:uncharacterized membrane protein